MLSQAALDYVNEFHNSHPGLDPVTTEAAAWHDFLHSFTNLSTTLEDEEIVLNITEVLSGGQCSPQNADRVYFFISILSEFEPEIFTEITNYYYESVC